LRKTISFLLAGLLLPILAMAAHSVLVTITDTTNPAGTTYNVYRGTGACSSSLTLSKLGSTSTKTYTDATVQSGNTYCYAATAVNTAGDESAQSPEAPATLAALPAAVTITVTVQ